jgi:hypothetical protein
VQQVRVDRVAEARDHNRDDEQRHRKVEVFVDEAVAASDCASGTREDSL